MSSRSRRSYDQRRNNTNTTRGSRLFDPSMIDDNSFSDPSSSSDSDDDIIIFPSREETRTSNRNRSTAANSRPAPSEATSDGRPKKRRKTTSSNRNGTITNSREADVPVNVPELLESDDNDVEESDDDDDDEEEDEDDEIVILGSDGETEEKSKTTADMLKDSNKTSTKSLKDVTCPICFDGIEKCVASPCGHFYCSNCVYKALASSKVSSSASGCCALCRKTVNYKDLVWLKVRFLKKT
ncbi:unnamed protein product [Ambrosiozyma monospora]|uniref:Unnamed protein product n=1 Tax=Ambrosiozyma monospora TaxID=43982 RepID=A0ACB5SSC3_AMBMO|nr:unnamed protein product [Ambrosiozyma monospora]